MRIAAPILLLFTLLPACRAWAQSAAPDRYLVKTGAEYITGYPYMPRDLSDRPKRVKGDLYLGVDALRFRFCSASAQPDPLAAGFAGAVDNSRCHACGARTCMEVRIPYQGMKLLARGRVTSMGGTSEDVQVVSIGISVTSLVAGIATEGATAKWLIGGTAGLGALAFGFHEYTLKRSNYMSIFFAPPSQADLTQPCGGAPPHPASSPSAAPAGAAAATAGSSNPVPAPPAKPASLFADAGGCNMAIFQIFNAHEYWNMSLILNSRTGKTFVAQNAEQK
jgi:hypothetical protein